MTAIVTALNRFHNISIKPSQAHLGGIFSDANRGGELTVFLLGILGLGIVSYLASLFIAFQLGFSIQEIQSEFEERRARVADMEFKLQQLSSESLLPDANAVITSMERVTSIKYLSGDGSVALQQVR